MLPEIELETPKFYLDEAKALPKDKLAEYMKTGRLEVVVDGALSEWGSQLETMIRNLESCVMTWHEDNCSKTLTIHFSETNEDNIIRLEADA